MKSLSLLEPILLNNGSKMPRVGLGTYLLQGDKCQEIVKKAVHLGYRLIDTADSYENEHAIGAATQSLEQHEGINRKQLFVTTKIGRVYQHPEDIKTSLEKSLEHLKTKYVDLLLLHSPFGLLKHGDGTKKLLKEDGTYYYHAYDLAETWAAMENVVREGKARSVGLSNFSEKLMRYILSSASIKPQNLQFECHTYYQQNELKAFCDENEISCTAYGTLGNPGRPDWLISNENKDLKPLQDDVVLDIAKIHNKTPAQILLRFLLERNIAVIPKSSHEDRLKENIDLFDFSLENEDVLRLKALNRGLRFFTFERYRKHPYFPKDNEPF